MLKDTVAPAGMANSDILQAEQTERTEFDGVTKVDSAGSQSFESHVALATDEVRQIFQRWHRALPEGIRRPADLQRATKFDYTLCWQIFNLAQSDGFGGAAHVPGLVTLKRIVATSMQLSIAEDIVLEIVKTHERFYAMVKLYANDRVDFDAMVDAVANQDQVSLTLRRNASRIFSQIWGIQTETTHKVAIYGSRPSRDTVAVVNYNARIGLRWLRPNASRIVSGTFEQPGSQPSSAVRFRFPLNVDAYKTWGAALLPEFCTQPLPKFRTYDSEDGWRFTEIEGDGIGRQSAVDLAFAAISDAEKVDTGIDLPHAICSMVMFGASTQRLVLDRVVHRPTFGEVSPSTVAHEHRPGGPLSLSAL